MLASKSITGRPVNSFVISKRKENRIVIVVIVCKCAKTKRRTVEKSKGQKGARPVVALTHKGQLLFYLFSKAVKSELLFAWPSVSPMDVKCSCPPRLVVVKCRDDPRDGLGGTR